VPVFANVKVHYFHIEVGQALYSAPKEAAVVRSAFARYG
jgi:hypothetical protein